MSRSPESERYKALSEHFQACAEMSPEERRKYLSGPLLSDPALRAELKSLFEYHEATPQPAGAAGRPSEPERHDTRTRRQRSRWKIPALVGAAVTLLALVVGARSWILGALEADLRRDALNDLAASVETRVNGIRMWADRQRALARNQVDDPAFIERVAELVKVGVDSKGDKARILAAASYKPIAERMAAAPPEINEQGYILIDPSGLDLVCETEAVVGLKVTSGGAAYLRRCVLGEWILSRPYPDRQFALGLPPDYENPVMFVAGPVYDRDHKLLAMAVFRFSPNREFYRLLGAGPGTALAFDERGLLLNPADGLEDLRARGALLGSNDIKTTLLRARLRDPGGDLGAGYRPESTPDTWPPTVMVRRATDSSSPKGSAEYRDHLGRTVLGAWTWLPEWEMGLGEERDVRRILTPLQSIGPALTLLLFLPLGAAAGLVLATGPVRALFRRGTESQFGSYVLERRIGRGGMAEVFLAKHAVLKRPTAVKVLGNLNPDAATIARFEREARLACRLGHPNTIQIFDYGETPQGKLYYAMEYVEGVNLGQLMAMEGRLPVARAVYLLRQVAGALEEAHKLGLVHRDLKPSNIMVCGRGGLGDVVKVLDFGIASASTPGQDDFTRSVEIVGTPAFLAPERIRDPKTLDPRSDVYSFGAVAFHLLTGRNAFEGSGPAELLYQVMTARRPSPSQLRGSPLPGSLESLVLECLEIDPAARPESFSRILVALTAVVTEDRWSQDEARAWWETHRDRVAAFGRSTA